MFVGNNYSSPMDIVPILLGLGVVLLVYQLVFRRDEDRLDKRGRSLTRKRK